MPRRSSAGSRRPTGSRSASTATMPRSHPAPPPAPARSAAGTHEAQPRQPGLFGQMASTAAGVAVGSTIGHTLGAGITSMFGGSSAEPAEQTYAAQQQQQQQQQQAVGACDTDARAFTKCLEENNGNMQICDYYLQQLKACQEAARIY
ncbi:hypothetical protein CANCADRAFT_110011 [Tortispora caseinolytica NRRL Y-17796]|uniref:CHCH domain-containing protein n=1 Tax=Tortispora caseinolytica NRRL Y-17796 TaxID=767744 RepID=A0A1E4TG54_9ASCO|nr:hypothetical protein CANCADRAFT_110011 [Tortispora caseinolytica NRRL Y-17796]